MKDGADMIVYIAGPMSGHEDYNRPAFNDAARRLAEAGHVPINPAVLPTQLSDSAYMPICTSMIDGADAIYLLDGWERSGGAMAEFAYARRQGKRIYTQAQLLGDRAIRSRGKDNMSNETINEAVDAENMLTQEARERIARMFSQRVRVATPQPRQRKYGQMRRTIDVFLQLGLPSIFINAPDPFGRDKAALYDALRKAIERSYQDAPIQAMMRSGEAGVWLMRTDVQFD